ncbi:MAG: tetratricopeptide repeat protein [Syntrophobacteraceae bacterium]|nr:tetratricopeptide repeat protein [Syntrophobacteraceae bacterium]
MIMMNRFTAIFLFVFLTPCFHSSFAADSRVTPNVPMTWQSHLDQLQKWAGAVGAQVVSLPSGKIVWEHRASEPLVPASLVKLFTSYTALKRLGPNGRFTTSIWAESEPVDRKIPGNIWIRGDGDIFFVTEKARELSEKSLALYRELNDKFGVAQCLDDLGGAYLSRGDYQQAREIWEYDLKLRK